MNLNQEIINHLPLIKEALKQIEEWGEENTIQQQFGLDYEVIKYLFEGNIIKQEWINILYKCA